MNKEALPRFGRLAWATLGILALAVVAGMVLRSLGLVVVPLVLALFPATLLVPAVRRLEGWRVPQGLAAGLALLGGLVLFFGIAIGTVTIVVAQLPDVLDSAGEGVERVEELVGRVLPGFDVPAADEIQQMILDQIQGGSQGEEGGGEEGEQGAEEGGGEEGGSGDIAMRAVSVTFGAVEVVAGIILTLVILFFYLKSGRALAAGLARFVAPSSGERVMTLADEAWDTLGAYFRGQLLVALSDAVLIGIGLLLLGIPLALPLSALVFFGGLFPILGALVTGGLAVLVAFAHGGLGIALGVAGIVLVVQQVEGNVLQPLILSRAVDLTPLAIIVSIAVGAIVLGMLGAFLAVPTAAIGKQLIERLREAEG